MTKKIKITIISTLVLLSGLCVYLLFTNTRAKNEKIVYMDNVKVFDSFEMKKDYDLLIGKELQSESAELDSLANLIGSYGLKGDTLYAFSLKKDYFLRKQSFDKKFSQLSQKYTQAVYEKLNGYIKEFAESKSYDLVLGASGEGNIMFVSEKLDVSEELITYINSKYNK
ncbi:MAG: OmpH family outer membrane protein [Bacteroidota bacterium]